MDRLALLNAIASRNGQSDIEVAGSYLRSLQACLDGTGPCDPTLWGCKDAADWGRILKEADSRLTYSDEGMSIGDLGTKGMSLTPGSILDFDAIITTSQMDRDQDILKSGGARLDPVSPLLMFHNPEMPTGRLVSKTIQNESLLAGRFCIFNTLLGRDAAVLVEGNGVRISHGFDPDDDAVEPLKGGRWLIRKYQIYEVSLVPIPANPGAIITAFSRGKLHHPFVKSFAKKMFDERTIIVKGHAFESPVQDNPAEHSCTCHKSKEAPVSTETAVATKASDAVEDAQNARIVGEGPQQGDHNWHSRHPSQDVQDAPLVGVDSFDVGKTAEDAIMSIATGSMTGGGRNPAPDTALAGNDGPAGEPGTPTPTSGMPNPAPTNPSTNPGAQKDVQDMAGVQPLDSDSAAHHTTSGDVNTNIDVRALRCMAKAVRHSGKEGAMYLHGDKGLVHHVMHPDDMHPDNSHQFHTQAEIQKMYGCCRGVTGVKCAVGMHPEKGMGYKMLHKGGPLDGEEAGSMEVAWAVEFLKRVREQLSSGKDVVAILKFSSLNPTGDPEPTVPGDDMPSPQTINYFTGMPSPNVANMPSMSGFNGVPDDNRRAPDDVNGLGKAAKATPPAGQINIQPTLADRPRTDPNIQSGVDGINTSESLSEQPIEMASLEFDAIFSGKSAEELEFDKLFEAEETEFDTLFANVG